MSWTYRILTGQMCRPDGTIEGVGYSGHGAGLNNPAMCDVRGVGPIPIGRYRIGPARTLPHLGPVVMALTPLPGTQMFDRFGFYIHGDNVQLDHTGSDGCIVFFLPGRATIDASEDRELEVVA
jgi:hypothetical protein